MSQNHKLTPEGIETLLNQAAQHLNIPPEKLKSQLQGGNLQDLGLTDNHASQLKNVLANPQMLAQIMKNPQILQLIKNLGAK